MDWCEICEQDECVCDGLIANYHSMWEAQND